MSFTTVNGGGGLPSMVPMYTSSSDSTSASYLGGCIRGACVVDRRASTSSESLVLGQNPNLNVISRGMSSFGMFICCGFSAFSGSSFKDCTPTSVLWTPLFSSASSSSPSMFWKVLAYAFSSLSHCLGEIS